MNTPIDLRPVVEQDDDFLYNLYKLSRVEEFSVVPLTEEQFDAVMKMQYFARKGRYKAQFPDSEHSIITVGRVDAGQIRVDRGQDEHRLIDISLSGPFQNQGIGTALLRNLIVQAQQAGVSLRCAVATNNPGSLRFHQRLGFAITSQDDMYYQMEHRK
jgi:ribosomal protein S18 acetylase RimI-like enzyme